MYTLEKNNTSLSYVYYVLPGSVRDGKVIESLATSE